MRLLLVMTTCAAVILAAPVAKAEVRRVWALDDGAKIRADEVSHVLSDGSGTYSPSPAKVRLFGLRNETVAFQVIVEGGLSDTSNVTVELPAIGPLDNEGARDDPDRYFLDRHIELFEQHYLPVRSRSHTLAWEPWTDAQPADCEGEIPDALIPHRKPFKVLARRNQGIWVDVYIPKDAPAGAHRGMLQVLVDGKPCAAGGCSMEVELEVLAATMPDRSTAASMVYFTGADGDRDLMPSRYFEDVWKVPLPRIEALAARHLKLARRHRITFFMGKEKSPTEELRKNITGETFTREQGYYGPAEGLGQDIYSIHTYGGRLTPPEAQMWTTWFDRHGPKTEYFLYTYDEPKKEAELFREINEVALAAKPVPAFVTSAPEPGLEVDIYASMPQSYSPSAIQSALEHGKRAWIYNGVRPFSGTFVIDDVAISPRVNPWIQYKHGIARWFYWEATYYKDIHGDRGQIDVFRQPINFSNGDGDRMNGDGLLVYPGRDVKYPDQDRGMEMPLPSIRLKNWRRGIQDVEYLVLLEQSGMREVARSIVQTLVPRSLADEARHGDPVSWPEDGERWLQARRAMFDALRAGQPPAFDVAALARQPEGFASKAERDIKRAMRPLIKTPKRKAVSAAAGAAMMFILGFAVAMVVRRRRVRGA